MSADGITHVQGEVVVLASLALIDIIIKNVERLTIFARTSLSTMEQVQGLANSDYGQVTIGQAVPC